VFAPSAHGECREARQVRARARAGISLAPADLAATDPREMLALLLLVAGLEQEGSDHLEPEADECRSQLLLRHLLGQDLRLLLRETAAAVLPRPRRRRPAPFRHH